MEWTKKGGDTDSVHLKKKKRQVTNAINVLMINNSECTDNTLILEEVHRFCSISLFENIKTHLPSLSIIFAEMCDSEIEMRELDKARRFINKI